MVAKQKFAAQYGRKDVAYKQTAATLAELHNRIAELRNTIVDSSGTDTLEDVGRTKQLMEEQQITMHERKKAVEQQNAYMLPIYSSTHTPDCFVLPCLAIHARKEHLLAP